MRASTVDEPVDESVDEPVDEPVDESVDDRMKSNGCYLENRKPSMKGR